MRKRVTMQRAGILNKPEIAFLRDWGEILPPQAACAERQEQARLILRDLLAYQPSKGGGRFCTHCVACS